MLKQYRRLWKGEQVVVGCDLSMGLGDYNCAQFLSRRELDVFMIFHSKCIATEMTNQLFPILEQISDKTGKNPLIAYERNNGGVFELERLAHLNKNNKFNIFQMRTHGNKNDGDETQTVKLGWDTNLSTRSAMLIALKEVIDNRLVRIYDKTTIEELFSFVKVQTSTVVKAQAEKNCHDDTVMALAIAWQLYLDVQSEDNDAMVSSAMDSYRRKLIQRENEILSGVR